MEWINIITAIGAIGTFCTGIAAIIGLLRYFKNLKFKEEYCYGEEAEERYKMINGIIKREHDFDHPYGGGTILVPRFEVKKFIFDKQTMPPEWVKHRKVIRFYNKDENGIIMLKGWRLK